MTFETCPHCEANFRVPKGAAVPPHRWRGTPCPGAPCPGARLSALIAAGHARIEGGEVVGLASDGTEVSLGSVRDAPQIETYLVAHPTPDTW